MTDGRLRLAAFDLDGTLLDSIPAITEGVRICWEALGFPEVETRAIRSIIGLPWEEGVRKLMPGAGPREVRMIQDYYAAIVRGERPRPPRPPERIFPGVESLLDRLEAEGYLLAIVTSRSSRRLPELLSRNGLADRFVSVQTADLGPGKPNPHLLLQAMRIAGVETHDTVMIGDTIYDVQAGVNAGTPAIGVSWGVHGEVELREAGAGAVAHAIEDLFDLVEQAVTEARAA